MSDSTNATAGEPVVQVKPLEWSTATETPGGYFYSDTLYNGGHTYFVHRNRDGEVWLAGVFRPGLSVTLGYSDTEDEAKAICQADHDRRMWGLVGDPVAWVTSGFFPTPDAAKAAAQADYEARIRAALVTEAQPAASETLTRRARNAIVSTRGFLRHFNPAQLPSDKEQQWHAAYDAMGLLEHALAQPAAEPVLVATHRHKKRGTEYVLIGFGKMQTAFWFDGLDEDADPGDVDMREVAIYRSVDDGSLWVRPREEFEDGRFEALRSLKTSEQGNG